MAVPDRSDAMPLGLPLMERAREQFARRLARVHLRRPRASRASARPQRPAIAARPGP